MKPPVTIDALMDMWSKDSPYDDTEPGKELIRIPLLHSKYLNILHHHKLILAKVSYDYNKMKAIKWQYYNGKLNNTEDLAHYGWPPLLGTIIRQDVPMHLDADDDLNKLSMKKIVHSEIVDYCIAVLKEIHSRTFQLKAFIEWERFAGGN
jgi:hypothetical protein